MIATVLPWVRAEPYLWRNAEIGGGGFVTGTVFHPSEAGLVYARTDVGGVYRLDPKTMRWIPLNDEIGGLNNEFQHLGVMSVGLDPENPERVYIATGQYAGKESWKLPSRIYRSTDRGNSWTYVTPGFKMGGNGEGRGTGERMAVDPLDGSNILVGSNNAGIWRSTDHGESFSQLANFAQADVTFLIYATDKHASPGPNRRVYAGANTLDGHSFWFSDDNGNTWAEAPDHPGKKSGSEMMPLQASFDAAGELYTTWGDAMGPGKSATNKGVWKLSADAGTWTPIHPPKGQGFYAGIGADARIAGHIVVSTVNRWWPGDEIYRSTDGGATWTEILRSTSRSSGNSPWSSQNRPHWITDIDIDPFDSNRAIFNTGFGLFHTNNLSADQPSRLWTFWNDGLEEVVPLGLYSPTAGPPLISVIHDYTGFRHDWLDRSPQRGTHQPISGSTGKITGAAMAPRKMIRQSRQKTYFSVDAGATWAIFPSEPPTVAKGHGTAAISADGKRIIWCPIGSEAFLSLDDGATWRVCSGTPPNATLIPIADRSNPLWFYLWNINAKILMISKDGGIKFAAASPSGNPHLSNFTSVPGHAGHIWATAGDRGLFASADGGATFKQLGSISSAYRISFGKAAPGHTYPAVFLWGKIDKVTGFYRSDDAGANWTRINDDHHHFGYPNALEADPRVHGRVFIGTSGRGVVVGEIARPAIIPRKSELVYGDAPSSSWTNRSGPEINLYSRDPVRRGNAAVHIPSGSGEGLSLDCKSRSLVGMGAISFWVLGESGKIPPLQLGISRGGIALEARPIRVPKESGWQRIQIALADIGLDQVNDLTNLRIASAAVNAPPSDGFSIDDIVLIGLKDFARLPR